MKKTGIPKETLTMKNIRRDLNKKLWKSWLSLVLCAAVLAGIVFVVFRFPAVLFTLDFWLCFILYVVLVVWSLSATWSYFGGLRYKLCIVKDRLFSARSGEYIRSSGWGKGCWCVLSFARYGDYSVPQKNHQWSKLYPLSCMGVYYHASEGDEYYLVLSRPHNGAVLLAYNAKLFQLEGGNPTET